MMIRAYEDGTPTRALMIRFSLAKGTVLRLLQDHGVTMRRQPGLNQQQIAQAIELYQRGWSLARLADHFSVSAGTVHARIREAGIPTRDTHGRAR